MSVFSNIGKNISNKGKEISRKAKVMSETSSLNNIIKGEECKIDTQYKLMGKMYFEKYGSSPEQEFSPAIEAIKNSMEKINETKQEIIKIKSQFCCPECGTPFKNDAVFCSKCGTKLPEKAKPQSVVSPQSKKCSNCGNVLDAEAIFCNVCGTKFENMSAATDDSAAENTVSLPSEVPAASPEIIPEKSDTINTDTAQASDETLTDAITDSSLETKESSTVPNESLEPHKFFCPNCKNEMQEDDVFCNECGTKVK